MLVHISCTAALDLICINTLVSHIPSTKVLASEVELRKYWYYRIKIRFYAVKDKMEKKILKKKPLSINLISLYIT